MNPYDPKLLEAWFRFMAEATRSGSEASGALRGATEKSSPPADFTRLMTGYTGGGLPSQPEAFAALTNAWFEGLGLVPKSRYDVLERQYKDLLQKFEEAERTARMLKASSAFSPQGDGAKEALKLWEEGVQRTLEAQTRWWQAWRGKSDSEPKE